MRQSEDGQWLITQNSRWWLIVVNLTFKMYLLKSRLVGS